MNPIVDQIREQVRGAWRYRWYALATAWVLAVAAWIVVFALPDRYEAGASVFVDTRTPLTPALQGLTVQQDVNSQLNFVRQSLLAGSQLEKIAVQAGVLTATERDPARRERVLDEVAKHVQITQRSASDREDEHTAGSIYDLSYLDTNQTRCLSVIQIMLKTFIEQTLGGKREGSQSAQQFLQTQITDYERRLRATEDRLAAFKTRHVGLMPSEQGGYFAQMQKETDAVTDLQSKLHSAENRRNTLQNQLRGDAAVAATGTTSATIGSTGAMTGTDTVSRIAETQAHLDELLLKYTDMHPDVVATRETLVELKARRAAEIASLRRGDADAVAASRASTNPVYQSIQLALNQAELDVSDLRSQLAQHQVKVQELNQLVTTAPQVEAEYAQLNRDYDVDKTQYTALLGNLEKAKLGERADDAGSVRFEVVQEPTVSIRPVWPRRNLLLLGTLVAALIAGCGLAYGIDQLHPVVGSVQRLTQITGVPVLGAVGPAFPARAARVTLRDRMLMALTVACFVGSFVLAVVLSREGFRVSVAALRHMVNI